MQSKDERFAALAAEVQRCNKCERMQGSARVLTTGCGPTASELMFIGEAPGRLGADGSHLPFHGDKSGHNFEALIEQVGLSRYNIFVTNAVLCNPRDGNGNNATPTPQEIRNCSPYLSEQIAIVDPRIVVTLGTVALKACGFLERHDLTLSDSVRTSNRWLRRTLVPCYHPGQRAMVHRSFANQLSDYHFIVETLRREGKRRPKRSSGVGPKTSKVAEAARLLLEESNAGLSYFELHKILFLAEVDHIEQYGSRIVDSYVIRQKDGPYYVDLHPAKLAAMIPGLTAKTAGSSQKLPLTNPSPASYATLTGDEISILRKTLQKYQNYGHVELKRRTYLTKPMRALLRKERSMRQNMFNAPLLVPDTI